ncbi:hypothetical protein MBANPS3_010998 [Mucor bainieri]
MSELVMYQEPEKLSEKDFDIMMYGRLFNLLFSNRNDIRVQSGETKFEDFKVDYRVRFLYKSELYDISHIELGKAVTTTKVKDDHMKIVLEGQAIMNNIILSFPFIAPNMLNIYCMQLCGLKGDVILTTMRKKKQYVADRVDERLRVPLNTRDTQKATRFFTQLLHYRSQVIKAVDKIKDVIQENDDRRRSFERVLGKNKQKEVITYKDWVA